MNRNALFALTAAGLLWGLTIPLSKLALAWLDPLWLNVARFALAAPLLAWIGRRGLRAAATPGVLGWGVLCYGAVLGLQNLGIERTSVTHAALIVGAIPALVAVIAALRGTGASGPLAWSGFLAAFAGVGLVAGSGGAAGPDGDALVFASAALSAAFIVAQPRLLAGRHPVSVTAVQMTAGALASLPFALLVEGGPVTSAPEGDVLAAFAALVVAGSLLPFALYAYGQARVPAEVAGSFVNLEPLVGVCVGAIAFGEPLGVVHLAGAAAILAGVALGAVPRRSRPAPATAPA